MHWDKASAIKVAWSNTESGWQAYLKLAVPDGFKSFPIKQGMSPGLEISNERRCTGYSFQKGGRKPCPDFKRVDSGAQCSECRAKDIYTSYVKGQGSVKTDSKTRYSVYLAQIGSKTKVGVTRSGRVTERWVEQGAQETVELVRGISSEEALSLESRISEIEDISESIRKENKTQEPSSQAFDNRIQKVESKIDSTTDYSKKYPCKNLCYPGLKSHNLIREGRLPEPVSGVRGQIISNQKLCLAVSSGKVVEKASQKTFSDYS
jgi:hypothetical protein